MTTRKVKPGERVVTAMRADTWNSFVDAASFAQRFRSQVPRGQLGLRSGELPGQVLVKNNSGGAVNRRNVLGIDDSTFGTSLQFQHRPILDCVSPTNSHLNLFVVTDEPIDSGAVGLATINGAVPVQVNISDTGHEFCTAANATTANLVSATEGGSRLLWKATAGTGTQWCLVRIGDSSGGGPTYSHTYGCLWGVNNTTNYNLSNDVTVDFLQGISGGITASTSSNYLQMPSSDDYLIGFSVTFEVDTASENFFYMNVGLAQKLLHSFHVQSDEVSEKFNISGTIIAPFISGEQLQLSWGDIIGATGNLWAATLFAIQMN